LVARTAPTAPDSVRDEDEAHRAFRNDEFFFDRGPSGRDADVRFIRDEAETGIPQDSFSQMSLMPFIKQQVVGSRMVRSHQLAVTAGERRSPPK
jgi:hypothetical protein